MDVFLVDQKFQGDVWVNFDWVWLSIFFGEVVGISQFVVSVFELVSFVLVLLVLVGLVVVWCLCLI